MSAELVLHLELNGFEVDQKTKFVTDASGKKHVGTLQGGVDIVADETFGACASFDGTAGITVPSDDSLKITSDVTVEAWVYVSKEGTNYVRIVGQGINSRTFGLWSSTEGGWLFQRSLATGAKSDCKIASIRTLNTWYHLAGVIQGTKGSLYIHDLQGKCIGQPVVNDMPSGPAFNTDDPFLTIGHGVAGYPAHTGRVAHVRVYNGALSQAEIERDVARDRAALVAFRKSHPIDFHLYDEDDQPVLYISDDPDGHNLKLELHNNSAQAITLTNGVHSPASHDNHHFALRFRPGTLSKSTLGTLLKPKEGTKEQLEKAYDDKQKSLLESFVDEWEIGLLPDEPAANQPVSLYLLYKDLNKTQFRPNEYRELKLKRMSAAPGSGARGTQVELLPRQLTAVGGDGTPITGSRTQYMHITNQIGHKNIPLHVWLEGGNTVLNDKVSGTDLTLCIGNGSARDITLANAEFLISFDVGDAQAAGWALTTSDYEKGVTVESSHGELTTKDAAQGISRVWTMKFSEKDVLKKRGSEGPRKITIKNIKTSLPSGHANLYLRYQHVPGYQDGQFILTVEKSPIVCKQGRVGIGGEPGDAETLRVNGSLRIDGGRTSISGFDGSNCHWIKAGAVDATEPKSVFMAFVRDRMTKHPKAVHIAPGAKLGLSVENTGKVGIGTSAPNSMLSVAGALAVGETYAATHAAPANTLIVEGKVGIGTPQPMSMLSVAGGLAVGATYAVKHIALANTLIVEGKVGIGTPQPKSTLSVAGGLAVGATYAATNAALANNLIVEGNVGIGTPNPEMKLEVRVSGANNEGIKGVSKHSTGVHGANGDSPASLLPDRGCGAWGESIHGYGVFGSSDFWVGVKAVSKRGIGLHATGDVAAYFDGDVVIDKGALWIEHTMEPRSWKCLAADKNNPSTALWRVRGEVPWSVEIPSDLRFKSELRSVPSALDKVRHLRGVTYRWNDDALRHFTRDIETTISAGPNATDGERQKVWQMERDERYKALAHTNVGVIAQDVEAVLPEAVSTDAAGFKSVRYHHLIALLLEALKEQDKTVHDQSEVVAQHREMIARLTAATSAMQLQLADLHANKPHDHMCDPNNDED